MEQITWIYPLAFLALCIFFYLSSFNRKKNNRSISFTAHELGPDKSLNQAVKDIKELMSALRFRLDPEETKTAQLEADPNIQIWIKNRTYPQTYETIILNQTPLMVELNGPHYMMRMIESQILEKKIFI
jgi:hypothetical protein